MSAANYQELGSTTKNKMGNFATSSLTAVAVAGLHTLIDQGELLRFTCRALGIKPTTLTDYSLITGIQAVGVCGASFVAAHVAGWAVPRVAEFYADTHVLHRQYTEPLVDFSRGVATVLAAGLVALNLNAANVERVIDVCKEAKREIMPRINAANPAALSNTINPYLNSRQATLG